ncbi:unnamed protein product [Malus baccata var. baccata]
MRLAERREGGRRRRKATIAKFMFIVENTDDLTYRAVSMLLSELKDGVDAKIVVVGIATTCSQKIHNRMVCT